ncbi:PepSY domain-containing protein [uncultured Anaerococcus sp.]|uniref:PepSY domain-containing protein n=1 Tax=uncultured Anaerococcus sp. TaxID=293428 RepID=UPI00288BB9F1|nr:PepSY domain-containing protein [uncultured Anaerococcus sp.]
MIKKVLIAFLAIVSLLTGCNSTNKENTETGIRQVENKDTKISKIKKESVPDFAKSLDDALKIFHNHNFGEANMDSINIDKIKMEFTNELFILKIEGFKNGKIYMLTIDDNAQIIDEKIEDDKDNKTLALDFKNIIPGTLAMENSLNGQAKGAWVKGYELKIEDGKAIYDIDIAEGRDIKIDAVTGEIIERD